MSLLLDVDGLSISYRTGEGRVHALRKASVRASAGDVIGIVGESGSGKSTLVSAIINLLGGNAAIECGEVRLKGEDILSLPPDRMRAVRGRDIAMVFQDPMTAFNPVLTLGEQLVDFQFNRDGAARADKLRMASEMLAKVGIPDSGAILKRYPHELSGGMRQRAAIAAALLMTPSVLVADEPTTALDVTMEAQIIHLFRALSADYQGAIVIVTHHLGVVAELCNRVYVMYAGEVVEEGPVDEIYHDPRHPYTNALMECDPARFEDRQLVLPTIAGRVPDLLTIPSGCAFAERCPLVRDACRMAAPDYVAIAPDRAVRCLEAKS